MNPLSNLFTETVDAAPTSALTVDLTVIAWLVITSTVVGAFADIQLLAWHWQALVHAVNPCWV